MSRMAPEHKIFDRGLGLRRRQRAAAGARQVDFLLERVAEDFIERLSVTRRTFPLAAAIGAYHGLVPARLMGQSGIETFVTCEAAPGLLAAAPGLRVQADDEALPFRNESLNLVVSALTLQFANDLPGVLIQIRRALKPDGLFLGAMLGGETLTELRQSLLAAEEELEGGASPRVAPFADVRDLGSLLQRAQFALPVSDAETVRVTYAHPLALMRELRAMGATNTLLSRRRTPLRRATLARACEIYAHRFGLPNGRVPATFEIMTMTGWAPHESQQKPLAPGTAKVSLTQVLGKDR
jgi:SAM-dependent methyltransferase